MHRMIALRMGITDRTGLLAECFLGRDHGFTGHADSSGTWTIAMTRGTVTTDPCLNAELRRSTTFMGMRRGMGGGMKGRLRTARKGNTRCRDFMGVVDTQADTTDSGLGSWFPIHAQRRLRTNGALEFLMKGRQKQILRCAYPIDIRLWGPKPLRSG